MESSALHSSLRVLLGSRPLLAVWLPLLAITLLHYASPAAYPWIHDVARRLYYLPIISAAFFAGVRGGMALALGVIVIYLPHAFAHWSYSDPGSSIEKILEMALYVVVGVVTGLVVDRERKERLRQQGLAARLTTTLHDLQKTRDLLVRSWRLGALGQLTAGLAHEIKNPLHAMRGTAEIVRDGLAEESTERRMMELHLEEIDRLTRLLERFLGFARPPPPSMSQVDLASVLGRVLDLVGAQARRQDVRMEANLVTGRNLILGDRDQLVQLVMAIVLNGLQALAEGPTENGRILVEVSQRAQDSRAGHNILIRNNGPPIPQDMLETIFDPFVTTRTEGTGLGLSIASRIADLHGGYIRVRNPDSGGVEFLVSFPGQLPGEHGEFSSILPKIPGPHQG